MKNRFLTVAVAALVALVLALAITRREAPVATLDSGGPLVAGLEEHINDVDRITLTAAADAVIVTLERVDGVWRVAERDGFPADFVKVRRLLLDLANSRRIEAKTAIAENFAAIGVEDVAGAAAKGVRIDLAGLPEPRSIIIGTFTGLDGEGTFVRDADQQQAWLASGSLIPDRSVGGWLDRAILDVPAARVREVEHVRGDERFRVVRATPDAPHLTLVDVPRGREPASEFAADPLGGALGALVIEDVAKGLDPPADGAEVVRATYHLDDGIGIDVTAWPVDMKRHARFKARLDEAAAVAWIEREQAKANAAQAAATEPATPDAADTATAANAAGGESPAVADATLAAAPPPAVSAAAEDKAERLAALRAQVEQMNARFDGWTFQLPSHVYGNLNQTREGLLKPR